MELIKTTPYAYNWKVTAMMSRWGWKKRWGCKGVFCRRAVVGNNISAGKFRKLLFRQQQPSLQNA